MKLNQNFKNGSIDGPAYEKAIDGIAQQIADLTGLDVETVKNMIKCNLIKGSRKV